MKKVRNNVLLLFSAAALLAGAAAVGRGGAAIDDPYAPLRLYDGKWSMLPSGDATESVHIENHCTKTGLFYVCEQVVNGKPEALVVFLPIAKTTTGGEEYRMQALIADASPAGEWSKLTIEGEKWVYAWESSDGGKKIQWRNVNTFTGTDKIHFEVQRSDDGNTWKMQKSGDEQRGK